MNLLTLGLLIGFSALPALANVDNRPYQSPVRNQLSRGTCTAFAVAGALEAMPGMPTALSTQYMYAVAKKTELEGNLQRFELTGLKPQGGWVTREGEPLEAYAQILQQYGAPAEHFLPYDGRPPQASLACGLASQPAAGVPALDFLCASRTTDDELLRTTPFGKYHIGRDYEILRGTEAQSVERLKAILDDNRPGHWVRSIPVGYAILKSHWGDTLLRGNIDLDAHVQVELELPTGPLRLPLAMAIVRADYARLAAAGKVWLLKRGDSDEWGGHAVEIVGYDDTGFLIKNSWGTSWGDQGYGHVSFAYHRLLATTGLVIHSSWVKAPSSNPATLYMADYRLKTFFDPQHHMLSLSTYTESLEDPRFTLVTYQVYAQGIMGNWMRATEIPAFYSSPMYPEYWSQGYGAQFWNVTALGTRLAVVVTYYDGPGSFVQRTYLDVGAPGMHDFAPTPAVTIP